MNSDALELSELGAGRARRPSSGSLKRQTSREHNSAAAERSPNGPSSDPTKTLLIPGGSVTATPIRGANTQQPRSPNGRNVYRDPSRRLHSPRRQSSQVSRTLSVEQRRRSGCSISRCFTELLWFLIGLRHFFAEVPLLIVLVLSPDAFGSLFYLAMVFTCLPGLAAVFSNIRSSRKSKKNKCSFLVMQSFFLLFRLESFLRLFEVLCPSLHTKGAPWPARVAVAQAVSGSVLHLILHAVYLGWCFRPEILQLNAPLPTNVLRYYGSERILPSYEPHSLKHCGPVVSSIQAAVLFASAFHIGWAIAVTSMPPLFQPQQRRSSSALITASIWSLLRSTSLVTGTIGNFLLAGSRAGLVFMAVCAGAPPWVVPVVMGAWLAIRLTVQLGLHAWSTAPMPSVAEGLLATVSVPGTVTPRQLGLRCLLMGIQNVLVLVSVMTKARHKRELLLDTYRLAVLQVVAFIVGIVFLLIRLRWVDPTAPLAEGKCFHHRNELDSDA